MPIYRLGSRGPEVTRIQQALRDRGLYRGPLDGVFGGGTHVAVLGFQRANRLTPDARVGPLTWQALFGHAEQVPVAAIVSENLARRCLALTGAFETATGVPECFAGVSGDFDGQGISFGVLQWNFGQGTLQALLKDLLAEHPGLAQEIFGDHFDALTQALGASHEELMAFARSVQHPVRHTVNEPWRGYAKTLGRTPECQALQVRHANGMFERALRMCGDYDLWSERAVALMFDIVTQNGSIRPTTKAQILADMKSLPASLSDAEREVRRLELIANRRAEAASPRWVDDVRRRKLCIARGRGVVHGIEYDLEEQFGIRLQPFTVAA